MFHSHLLSRMKSDLNAVYDTSNVIDKPNAESLRILNKSKMLAMRNQLGEKDGPAGIENHQIEKFSLRQLAKSYAARGIYGKHATDSDGTIAKKCDDSNASTLRGKIYDSRRGSFADATTEEHNSKREPLGESDHANQLEQQLDLLDYSKISLNNGWGENKKLLNEEEIVEITNPTRGGTSNVVVLSDFPQMTVDLTSVLSQVCGGPLYKISATSTLPRGQGGWEDKLLKLSFLRLQDAEQFMEFASTGMFMINGYHIPVSYDLNSPNEIDDDFELVKEEMLFKGATRCLICKKNVQRISRITGSSRVILADFDATMVKQDFAKFGKIVEISAVVSKRLSFAVHFYQTRSAIDARLALEIPGTELNSKYSDWHVWYGKDPCDRPCYSVD